MRINHYDETTGAFIGVGTADPDPLDPTNWLVPAHATSEEPPQAPAGQFAAWNGSAWELRAVPAPEPVQVPEQVLLPDPTPVTREEQIAALDAQMQALAQQLEAIKAQAK